MFLNLYFILLILLLVIKPEYSTPMDPELIRLYSFCFLVSICLHFFFNSSVYKNVFRVEVIFLLGFSIVHFQWPLMFSFSDITPEDATRVWVDVRYVNYGTWLSAVGGISWVIGFNLVKPIRIRKQLGYTFTYYHLLYLCIFLFLVFLLTAGSHFLSGGVYKGEGGGSAGEGISAYIQLLFSISIIILTTIVVLQNRDKYRNNIIRWFLTLDKLYLSLILIYILLFFFIGDRGGPLSLILVLLFLIGTYVRPIKSSEFLFIVVIGAIFLTLVGLGRSESSGLAILSAGSEKLELNSGYDLTVNLANSVRTLYRALSEVPENHNYFFGQLWIGGILSPIPFAQSLFLKLSDLKAYELASTGYITYLTFGDSPSSGEGSSLIADIYLNFGVVGVVGFMFVLGRFFKKITNEVYLNSNINWIIIAALVCSFSLTYSRAGLLLILRPIVWSFFIFYFFVKRKRL